MPYNTQYLRENFLEAYKDFFGSCEVVCSTPTTFFWTGEYSVMHGAFSLLQKIPQRIYVGLEKRYDNKITINDYSAYSQEKNLFEKIEFNDIAENKIIKKLREIFGNQIDGLNIKILGEAALGYGPTTSGALSAALAAVILLHLGKIYPRDIVDWKNHRCQDLINNKDLGFDQVFRLAWKIESVTHADASSGAGIAGTMVDSFYPILYFSEKRFSDSLNNNLSKFPVNISADYGILDSIGYTVFRLNEISNLADDPFWPIDFFLVNTGASKKTDATIRSSRVIQKDLESLENFYLEIINLASHGYFKNPELLFGEKIKSSFWPNIIKAKGVISTEIIYLISKILSLGANHDILVRLLNLINCYHGVYQYLDLTSPEIEKIRSTLSNSSKVASKLVGGGKGGDLLAVAEQGTVSKNFAEHLKQWEHDLGRKLVVDYVSWQDGFESEGLKVEQCLVKNIQPDFIEDSFITATIYGGGLIVKKNISNKKINELIETADLFLDYHANKIYIVGKKLNSGDIHSATQTLEVLKLLLEKNNQSVFSDQLPASSYVDRNEMQSKVISPLKNSFKKYTGKNLPLTISGGLGSKFTISFKLAKNIKIIVI
ncbi:MAG: hypothetical protein WC675_05940 [Patescibacteria group bacterium]|jgi:mevalonate kinase